jgi:hypothetical protein
LPQRDRTDHARPSGVPSGFFTSRAARNLGRSAQRRAVTVKRCAAAVPTNAVNPAITPIAAQDSIWANGEPLPTESLRQFMLAWLSQIVHRILREIHFHAAKSCGPLVEKTQHLLGNQFILIHELPFPISF